MMNSSKFSDRNGPPLSVTIVTTGNSSPVSSSIGHWSTSGRARKTARQTVWRLAGDASPARRATVADPLIIDLDATLVTAHSEKEKAAATFKHRFRVPPVVRVRRPRPARDRGTVEHLVAGR
jgi:hypothetical protein